MGQKGALPLRCKKNSIPGDCTISKLIPFKNCFKVLTWIYQEIIMRFTTDSVTYKLGQGCFDPILDIPVSNERQSDPTLSEGSDVSRRNIPVHIRNFHVENSFITTI